MNGIGAVFRHAVALNKSALPLVLENPGEIECEDEGRARAQPRNGLFQRNRHTAYGRRADTSGMMRENRVTDGRG